MINDINVTGLGFGHGFLLSIVVGDFLLYFTLKIIHASHVAAVVKGQCVVVAQPLGHLQRLCRRHNQRAGSLVPLNVRELLEHWFVGKFTHAADFLGGTTGSVFGFLGGDHTWGL